jgi:cytochrome bd-type quinol oxidase subunit 1
MSAIRQATLVGLCLVMAALPAAAQSGATATRTKPAKRALYEWACEGKTA